MLRTIASPDELSHLKRIFDECRNVVITCHTSPDGDAIGSCLALYEYLTRRGKQVHIVVPNYFPDFLHWMHDADKIILSDRQRARSRSLFYAADLLVALDFNDLSRIDDLEPLFSSSHCQKLLIDHHLNATKFCNLQISRPEMSSTCELLYRLIVGLNDTRNINLHCAEDLYAGMCTDTGRFTYGSNDPEIFMIVSDLMRKGIDKDQIVRNIYNQNRESRYRLMGHILLNTLEIFPEQHAAMFHTTRSDLKRFNYVKGDAESIVNMPLEIKGIKLSISLREDTEKDLIYTSLRSVDEISANDFAAKYYNGGGHEHAAGGKLTCSMEEALELTRDAIKHYAPLKPNDN